ncbi:hypothetical protein GCM10023080_015620 [Streptomyces pseudoechinosporeus]
MHYRDMTSSTDPSELTDLRKTVETFWATAEARDWALRGVPPAVGRGAYGGGGQGAPGGCGLSVAGRAVPRAP